MAKDNSYLTSFKIDLVRQVMEGHELKAVAEKYGVSKSTLWGWKCKYGQMVCSDWNLGEPVRRSDGDFVDVVAPAKETAKDPVPLMQFRSGVVVMEHRGFTLRFDVGRLPEVLEMLGL
jgi:transposase-like protein